MAPLMTVLVGREDLKNKECPIDETPVRGTGVFMRIIKLSESFYNKYKELPEILHKESRPYYCLELRIDKTIYAIPLRHNISHQYAFHTLGKAGIDFSKAVIINDAKYVSPESPRIDSREWRVLNSNEDQIIKGFLQYLRLYRKAVKKTGIPKYDLIRKYSTLQYFEISE